jgi:hypothetical protein
MAGWEWEEGWSQPPRSALPALQQQHLTKEERSILCGGREKRKRTLMAVKKRKRCGCILGTVLG